jgi:type IV pilus assembly protein PilV
MNRSTMSSRSMRSKPHANRGIALIEALVSVLIFSIGILGLVGLQVTMTRAQGAAKFRADAAYLSSEIIGTMWADRPHLTSYATSPGAACSYSRCLDWVNKVTTGLPQGAVEMSVSASGTVTLTMTWAVPKEGTRTYAISTLIQ